MGESSYDKIYKRLRDHKVVQAFLTTLPEKIESVHVTGVEFSLERPSEIGQPAVANPCFQVDLGNGSSTTTSDGKVWLSLGTYITEGVMKPFIEELFGVKGGVPTYFCKKGIVTGDEYVRTRESFARWLRDDLGNNAQYKDLIEAAQARVLKETQALAASEETAVAQREFLVRAACEDIKKALGAYNHLGQDVLKAAVDEYLVHSIFEFEAEDD